MNKIIFQCNCFFGSNFIFFASWSDDNIVEYEIEDTKTGEITKSRLDKERSSAFISLISLIDINELDEKYMNDDMLDGAMYELIAVNKGSIHKVIWQQDSEPEKLKNIYEAVNLCEPLINKDEED